MSEKTEQPTQKRLRDARQRGEVGKSRDATTAAVLLVAGASLVVTGPSMLAGLVDTLRASLRAIESGSGAPTDLLQAAFKTGLDMIAPVLLATFLAAAVVGFVQVGPLLTLKPIAPKLERLDPIKGLKNLFSQRQLVELLKTAGKMMLIGYVLYGVLESSVRGVVGLIERDAMAALAGTGALGSKLLFRAAGALAAIAVLDVLYQRWRHLQDQRMTKDEVKREYKDSEGDPHAKQARERMHREIVEHNALEAVRDADVLIVNPTHIAVALKYDEAAADAPELVAKGTEHLARRMIAAAQEAGVPIVRDVPLARALFELELGEEIPEALYDAVAIVLRAAWDGGDEVEQA